jgi:hypothetical protein
VFVAPTARDDGSSALAAARWSPELTAAGRVRLAEGEVECFVADDVRLERGGSSRACAAVVTSRRVVFPFPCTAVDEAAALSFELAAVGGFTERSSGFFGWGEALLDLELLARAEGGASENPSASWVLAFRRPALREQFRDQLALQSARRQVELCEAELREALRKVHDDQRRRLGHPAFSKKPREIGRSSSTPNLYSLVAVPVLLRVSSSQHLEVPSVSSMVAGAA